MTVHTKLGTGLLESAYQACINYKLNKAGLIVEPRKPLVLVYEELRLECAYQIDLLVEKK